MCNPLTTLLYQTLFVTSFVTDCHGNGGKLVLYQINNYSIYVGYVVNGLLNNLMEITTSCVHSFIHKKTNILIILQYDKVT